MGCFCLPIVQISSMEIFIMKSMFRAELYTDCEAVVDIIRSCDLRIFIRNSTETGDYVLLWA